MNSSIVFKMPTNSGDVIYRERKNMREHIPKLFMLILVLYITKNMYIFSFCSISSQGITYCHIPKKHVLINNIYSQRESYENGKIILFKISISQRVINT